MVRSAVNFVLSPRASHFDPLSELFPEGHVEHGLESLYKFESISIAADSEPSDYDLVVIEEFKRGMELRDKQYYLELPWYRKFLQQVSDGLEIDTAVVHSVHANLTKKGLEA
jgi:hypothetical protein